MKTTMILAGVTALSLGLGLAAQAADEPFADQVETRHGLMLAMANDLGKLGAMVKGDVAYDPAAATAAATALQGVALNVTMDWFPEGSENGKATDSFAKAEVWTNNGDFLQKIADLNKASADLVAASGTDVDTLKAAMAGLGGACKGCHETYRQPEN